MSYSNPDNNYYLTQPTYDATIPPAPPPKPSPAGAPPLPPLPPGTHLQTEPQELDSSQTTSTTTQPSNPPPPPSYSRAQPPLPPNTHQPYPDHPQSTNTPSYPEIPAIAPSWLPQNLPQKQTPDLTHLLSTPSLLTAHLLSPSTTHPSVPLSSQPLQPLLSQNTSLATNLLNLESQLQTLRSETQSRLLSLRALEQQHRSKLAETERALEGFSPMALYQRLSAAVVEQEGLVRGLEESWLDEEGEAGEREVGEFVRRVREGKRVEVLRRERRERWDEGRVGGWR